MLAFALAVSLLPTQAPCALELKALVDDARTQVEEFDLNAAAGRLAAAVAGGCTSASIAAIYVRGLVDAREAFRQGGSPESLGALRQAIFVLDRLAQSDAIVVDSQPIRRRQVEIVRLTLQAAAAAAQSERDEMRLYLESAVRTEALQRAAGESGAPVIPAVEVAGDLWLQVHRYEEARQAYEEALKEIGPTLRIYAGLARAAARLNDTASACTGFRTLLDGWGSRPARPPEIVEAQTYLMDRCAAGPQQR